MELTEKQQKLLDYVKDMHMNYALEPENRFRKYTGEEYWTHPLAVARIVGKYEPDAVEMALCHDLFEDTHSNFTKLHEELLRIGYSENKAIKICIGVQELTNIFKTQKYPMLNRATRKAQEAKRLGTIGYLPQCVKYADIIHNGRTISMKDKSFAKLYLNEAIDILNVMRDGNINLLVECAYTIKKGLIKLN